MEANVHGLFRDDQLRASSSAKRPSKGRSRVWEKVVWFTRKAKGGKESKSDPSVFAQSPSLRRRNKRDLTSFGLNAEDCGTSNVGKAEQKVRKSRSFNYLRRRKLRQFADDLSRVMPEENRDLQNCHTATGTFHDFESERRISRQEVCLSSVSLFSEMTKGMNGSQLANENLRRILSLPLDELTLNDQPSRSLCTSPNLARVSRNVSFSGPAYNSWPRKKRTHLGNSCGDVLSPPLKQKRVSGLKKRATFSGFDSSKLISRNPSFCLRMGARSTPQLEHCGQIKNQNGSTVGVIHFYKSTARYQSENRTEKTHDRNNYCSRTKKDQAVANGRLQTFVCPQHCDEKESSSNCSTMFSGELCGSSKDVTEICLGDSDLTRNAASTVCKGIYHDNAASSDGPMWDADVSDGTNCLTFNIRSADGPNSAISAFVVEGDKYFNNCCINTSPGNDSTVEECLTFSGCPAKARTHVTVVGDNALDAGSHRGQSAGGSNTICGEKTTFGCGSTLVTPNEGSENRSLPPHCLTSSSSSPKNNDACESPDSLRTEVSQPAAIGVSVETISAASAESKINCKSHVSAFSDVSHVLPFGNELEKSEAPCGSLSTSDKKKHDSQKEKIFWSMKPKVKGLEFKQQMEVILQWFSEFNHEQKNALMRRLLDECELPQMHMLSVAMEPILHKHCPPNCQDMLSWLPHSVTVHILSFLDPVSLCRCSQVNQTWNSLTSNAVLWKNLCGHPDWQLSRTGDENERKRYMLQDGTIQWKKMFASRFLLYQNWLKGRCEVRTFEGHSQGISCVQFDDTRIVSGSSDKTIRVWDIQSGDSDAVLTLAGHSGTVRCLNLNGNRLVSGSVDRSIKVWDLSFKSYWSGASCKVTMVGHVHTVRCLQVDDEKIVSGSYDKTLKVWDIKTGHCKLTLRGHNAAVLCVQFDERKIVSGSSDKTIKVWCLSEGSCLMTLTGHHDAVTCLNLTFDSRKVISGSLDHNLKFWDLATGKCIGTLDWIRSEGHTGVIRCLQTDSWRIVSAGDDKTLKMWSLESGQRLLTLRCHTDGVTCLQFNDYSIVSGSYDKTVKFWDFTPAHEFLTPG